MYRNLAEEFDLAPPIRLNNAEEGNGIAYPSPDWMLHRLTSGAIAVLAASGD